APRARKAATPSGLLASFVEEGERYLIFTLAGIDYAIPAAQVLEVGRPPRVTPLPNVPEWLTGLTNVRGDIVSVVDLRGFLGMGPAGLGTSNRLVIVKATDEDVTTGLLVDRVRGIRRFPVTSFQQPDAIEDARIGPHVQGINEQDGSLLVSLDLNRMLRSREMRQFELA
ncbi:MAG TPA: chemotaxis protein CheW, partial [Gemmataceae bacterium]|nr:chemotaxis protein CheW [Gemmataceae bacterium]